VKENKLFQIDVVQVLISGRLIFTPDEINGLNVLTRFKEKMRTNTKLAPIPKKSINWRKKCLG